MRRPSIRSLGQATLNAMLWPVRTMRRMTMDGWIFLALALACGLVAARAAHLANIPLLVCLVLLSVLYSALVLGNSALRHLEVTRHCAERTFAGESVSVTLTVRNNARAPIAGLALAEDLRSLVRRGVPAAAGGAPRVESSQESQRMLPMALGTPRPVLPSTGQAFATVIPARSVERVRYVFVKRERGIYGFGRTRMSTVFPFGFWRTQTERRVPGRLVVYPRLGEIETSFFQEMEDALQRIRRARPSREEQDFRSLREYRHGDNPKWIHWRSSAKQGRALVKEFEEPQTRRVLLLLDTNLQRMGTRRLPSFELEMSFAATAARELVRRGCDVSCATLPPETPPAMLTVSRERRNLDVFLELLAGLQPDNTRTLADLRTHISREQLRHVFVLVLGLGSARLNADLTWLRSTDNVVKMLDLRGEEFRRIFHRGHGPGGREDDLEDLLLSMGDEELDALAQEELALVG
ncbi:MAG: DUF58 domain-containing protein [Planctomycetota bacterium]|nr:DUF58 domain-containing protein [Planctomycetota bacterium]